MDKNFGNNKANRLESRSLDDVVADVLSKKTGSEIAVALRKEKVPHTLWTGVLESPEIRTHLVSYVTGKFQKDKLPLTAVGMRIESSVPEELREAVANNEQVLRLCTDHVTGKSTDQEGSLSIDAITARLSSVPERIRSRVMNDEEVRRAMLGCILKPSRHDVAEERLNKLPEEVRSDIANNPEVQHKFPGIGK